MAPMFTTNTHCPESCPLDKCSNIPVSLSANRCLLSRNRCDSPRNRSMWERCVRRSSSAVVNAALPNISSQWEKSRLLVTMIPPIGCRTVYSKPYFTKSHNNAQILLLVDLIALPLRSKSAMCLKATLPAFAKYFASFRDRIEKSLRNINLGDANDLYSPFTNPIIS